MNGFARLFYALLAVALDALALVFVFPAEKLRAGADWCHERTLPPEGVRR